MRALRRTDFKDPTSAMYLFKGLNYTMRRRMLREMMNRATKRKIFKSSSLASTFNCSSRSELAEKGIVAGNNIGESVENNRS